MFISSSNDLNNSIIYNIMDNPEKYPFNQDNEYNQENTYNQTSSNADGLLHGLQIFLGLLSFSGLVQVLYVNFKVCYDDCSRRKKIKNRKIKEDELLLTDLCIICLENYKIGDKISILSCEHFYHKSCLNEWFNKKEECPICRIEI